MQRLEFSRFIFFVEFYIDEEKPAASPGAMASPDRRVYNAVLLSFAWQTLFDGAPTRYRLQFDEPQRGREFLFSRAASARKVASALIARLTIQLKIT